MPAHLSRKRYLGDFPVFGTVPGSPGTIALHEHNRPVYKPLPPRHRVLSPAPASIPFPNCCQTVCLPTTGDLRSNDLASPRTGIMPHLAARPSRLLHARSEEHTSELQSHSFISYAVF